MVGLVTPKGQYRALEYESRLWNWIPGSDQEPFANARGQVVRPPVHSLFELYVHDSAELRRSVFAGLQGNDPMRR